VIYGLGAALGWGLADFTAALVSRRMGSAATVVVSQFAGFLMLTVVLIATRPPMPDLGGNVLGLLLIGVLGALTYRLFYRGLQLGPIALVSPIVAGYASIVIVLSLVLLKERVPALALAGAGVTLLGVIMASTDPRAIHLRTPGSRAGVYFGIAAMVGFGIGAYFVARYAKRVGWFEVVYIERIGALGTLALLSLRSRVRGGGRRSPLGRWPVSFALLAGLLDTLAFASFARGSELGFVSIVAAASATYPLLPVTGGLLFLGERPAPSQIAGVPVVLGGLALLAIGR
jgi:drug/metabolite transporter (DMT)-like permease